MRAFSPAGYKLSRLTQQSRAVAQLWLMGQSILIGSHHAIVSRGSTLCEFTAWTDAAILFAAHCIFDGPLGPTSRGECAQNVGQLQPIGKGQPIENVG